MIDLGALHNADAATLAEALETVDADFERSLFQRADALRRSFTGEKVHLRGLVEISSLCDKNCLYCGIRHDNASAGRYRLTRDRIVECAWKAYRAGYASVVLQAGERTSPRFVEEVTRTVREVKAIGSGALGVTLSLGEQTRETYREWFEAGAHRYLLRIESSNPDLFARIHPDDGHHAYERRLRALEDLRDIGYQTGTGVMIGLPWQTTRDLAGDLLFIRQFDAPMVGMGPYIPHPDAPLAACGAPIPTEERRLDLSLRMIALLRVMMPDINIAATTALEVLDPHGREKALRCGANIVMPNITPSLERGSYNLYRGKESISEGVDLGDEKIGYGEWGDSPHFTHRGEAK